MKIPKKYLHPFGTRYFGIFSAGGGRLQGFDLGGGAIAGFPNGASFSGVARP